MACSSGSMSDPPFHPRCVLELFLSSFNFHFGNGVPIIISFVLAIYHIQSTRSQNLLNPNRLFELKSVRATEQDGQCFAYRLNALRWRAFTFFKFCETCARPSTCSRRSRVVRCRCSAMVAPPFAYYLVVPCRSCFLRAFFNLLLFSASVPGLGSSLTMANCIIVAPT
uniref:Uncharacterized protein n=1 Tax=Anopheles atroparvus TaxID=41427 RepID=A0AAG5DYL4_ANOAO